jgi:Fe-S cluster biogenesis protein NfuA
MIARSDIDEALDDVRPLVAADGADLLLGEVDSERGEVTLRLSLEGVSCLECVLPPELLHSMISDSMTRRVPGLVGVTIDDPRLAAS